MVATVTMRKATRQDLENPEHLIRRIRSSNPDANDRSAYKELAHHLSMPYMELRWPSEEPTEDVSTLEVVWCNQAMAGYLGVLSSDDLAGCPVGKVAPLLLPDLRLARQGGVWDAGISGRRARLADRTDQGVVTFRIGDSSATPSATRGSRIGVLVEGAAFRQQAVEALARRARELAALHETLLKLNAETDLHSLLSTIVARAAELLDASRGGLYLMRESDHLLELAVSYDAPGAYVETTLRPGEGVSGRATVEGKAILVGAERSWEERERAYPDAPIGPAVAVPLRLDGAVIGALYVGDDDRQSAFDHSDARLLSMFADQATLVIQRTRLLEQAQRDATQRAVLLREVNHRVRNNLTAIIGLLYAQGRSVAPEHQQACQEVLAALAARIQALATVHELLSRAGWGPVPFHDLASQVISSVLGSPSADITWRVSPSEVPAQHVAMVLNELASNVLRHARETQEPISCDVACWRSQGPAASKAIITFRDNGVGYPPGVMAGGEGGVGMDLIRNLVQHSLGGTLQLYNDGGAVARIEFPASWLDEEMP